MRSIAKQLNKLLANERGEREVAQFAQEPSGASLLYHYFVSLGGHCEYVLTEVSLGGDHLL